MSKDDLFEGYVPAVIAGDDRGKKTAAENCGR